MNKLSIEEKIDLNNLNYFLKIMRITLFFSIFCIGLSSASNSYSQAFSLNMKATSIKEICNEIERNSDYIFVFSDIAEERLDKKLDINATSDEISDILHEMFSKTGLIYRIIDKQIVIYESNDVIPELKQETPSRSDSRQPSKKLIAGKVTDAQTGEELIGVSVWIKESAEGTATDIEGNFSLSVDSKFVGVLQFSYIGYETKNITYTDQSILHVELVPQSTSLDEVQVVGFGTQRKESVIGAISSIDRK